MGLEKEPTKKKPSLPPVFTGDAIRARFPDFEDLDPKTGQKFMSRLEATLFPHWIYQVYLNDKDYDIFGAELETGMHIHCNGGYIQLIELDKKFLYHGMEVDKFRFGRPRREGENITHYKFIRDLDNNKWIIEELKVDDRGFKK